eukprot:6078217-Pyramimonas_sp.AAC.1
MCLTRQPIVRRAGGGIGHLEGAPPHPSGALQGVRVDATPRGWTLSKAEGGGRYAQGEPLQGVRGASEQRLIAHRARRLAVYDSRASGCETLGHEPIARVEREYTWGASQSHASRENIPGARANRTRQSLLSRELGRRRLTTPLGEGRVDSFW